MTVYVTNLSPRGKKSHEIHSVGLVKKRNESDFKHRTHNQERKGKLRIKEKLKQCDECTCQKRN